MTLKGVTLSFLMAFCPPFILDVTLTSLLTCAGAYKTQNTAMNASLTIDLSEDVITQQLKTCRFYKSGCNIIILWLALLVVTLITCSP